MKADISWNDRYERYNKIWGDLPSELALMAVSYFQESLTKTESLSILDVACGYGRDTFYLHQKLECRVTGVDISSQAIDMARASLSGPYAGFVQFFQIDFMDFPLSQFDVLFVCNFYHLLDRQQRDRFLNKVAHCLKPNGLLFLSTHSVRDPQLYGKGLAHPSDPDTFCNDGIYRHFSTGKDMRRDFTFLQIDSLYEHAYVESRGDGAAHHHISWMLVARQGTH